METKVEVKIHQPNPTRDQDVDAYLGATHAAHGKPVQVTIWSTLNSCFTHHLSMEQAKELHLSLGAALGMKDSRYEMLAQNTKDALTEVRVEIRRVNEAAGRTIFNPAATQMVDSLLKVVA